jgi:hypothetical protein
LAVSVQLDDESSAALREEWDRWHPGVALTVLRSPSRSISKPMLAYLASPQLQVRSSVLVLIPEVEPKTWRHQLLQNQRGVILANALRRHCEVTVARIAFRLKEE